MSAHPLRDLRGWVHLRLLSPHTRRHVHHLLHAYPGLRLTSGRRTAARNRQVGGVPGSLHLTGRAADLAGPALQMLSALAAARAAGAVEAIHEGDHVHLAW